MAWYVVRDGERIGPLTFETMVDATSRGQLSKDDLVWTAGMHGWQPAGTVVALWAPPPLPAVAPQPPPGPPFAQQSPSIRNSTKGASPEPQTDPNGSGAKVNISGKADWSVGAKIVLSVITFVIGSLLVGVIKDPIMKNVIGPVERGIISLILNLSIVGIIIYIWTRAKNK